MWADFKAWLAKQGGFSHVVGSLFIAAPIAYAAVPAFHQLVIDVWAITPPLAREAGFSIVGLYAWYQNTHKGV